MFRVSFWQKAAIFSTALALGVFWVETFSFLRNDTVALSSKRVVVGKKSENAAPMDSEIFTPPQVDENNPAEFDPEGDYFPVGLPKELDDFDYLAIRNKNFDVACGNPNFGSRVAPTGFVAVGEGKHERANIATSLEIQDGRISFDSAGSKGRRYHFEGRFLIEGNFYTLDPDRDVIRGTLTVTEADGRKFETHVSFNWSIDLKQRC
ncbi:MAG: hypothetical protein R2684_09535 [Pyrinomonadaceae bacterium]